MLLGGWTAFLLGIAAVGLVGAALALVFLPASRALGRAPLRAGSLRSVLRDRPFALLLLSSLLAYIVYCGSRPCCR